MKREMSLLCLEEKSNISESISSAAALEMTSAWLKYLAAAKASLISVAEAWRLSTNGSACLRRLAGKLFSLRRNTALKLGILYYGLPNENTAKVVISGVLQ